MFGKSLLFYTGALTSLATISNLCRAIRQPDHILLPSIGFIKKSLRNRSDEEVAYLYRIPVGFSIFYDLTGDDSSRFGGDVARRSIGNESLVVGDWCGVGVNALIAAFDTTE
jgi:hypothetical protein